MTQKQSVSPWVVTPAIRDPIRLPPDIRGVAHVVAFIRGLLLDDRLTDRDDYWALVALMRPEIQAIKGEAEAVVSPGWIDKAKARNGRLFVFEAAHIRDNQYGPEGFGSFQDGQHLVTAFADGGLKSETAQMVLWALVTVEACGANPLALEWKLSERCETWQTAYGNHTDRLSRRKHKEFMAQLKREGWKELNDSNLLDTARAYVELHHVFGGRLTDWLKSRDGRHPRSDDVSKWSARFKPFDEALGRPRVKGWPKERRPSV